MADQPAAVRPWIPPVPLLFAAVLQLVSWGTLALIGAENEGWASPIALAWVHEVTLGWLSLTALAFLFHIVPGFTDVRWRFESLARAALWFYMPGVVLLVIGFWRWNPGWIEVGASVVIVSLLAYAVAFFATLARAIRELDGAVRAISRALGVTFAALLATAGIGIGMAFALGAGKLTQTRWVDIHATLGTLGWLGVLVLGVSARTHNRLIGKSENRRRLHIPIGSLSWLGLMALVVGYAGAFRAGVLFGALLMMLGALLYALENLWSLAHSIERHLLPRLFLLFSQLWMLLAVGCAGAALRGDSRAIVAMFFVLLVGWIGQAVNAHLSHVGIRLLATIVRGDDDETPPMLLLDARVGWVTVFAYQLAVLAGVLGIMTGSNVMIEIAGVTGMLGSVTMFLNVGIAMRRARRLPLSLLANASASSGAGPRIT